MPIVSANDSHEQMSQSFLQEISVFSQNGTIVLIFAALAGANW